MVSIRLECVRKGAGSLETDKMLCYNVNLCLHVLQFDLLNLDYAPVVVTNFHAYN